MKNKIMPGLLISFLIMGAIYGITFHVLVMPLFNGQLLHCIIMGIVFSLISYFIARKFFFRYYLIKQENSFLNKNIKIDELTGLFNRRKFDNDMKKISGSEKYSVIFIDIDDFSNFNNKYGHQVGDMVLRKVSKTIKFNVKDKGNVYRYGGEEIVVILKNFSKNDAIALAEKVRHSINVLDNTPFDNITISLGVACESKDGDTINEVVKSADDALLKAKFSGKNRVAGY